MELYSLFANIYICICNYLCVEVVEKKGRKKRKTKAEEVCVFEGVCVKYKVGNFDCILYILYPVALLFMKILE